MPRPQRTMSEPEARIFPTPKTEGSRYARIENSLLRDERLSFSAKGVGAYLLTNTPEWAFSAKSLASLGPDGEAAMRSAIRELEALGYIERKKVRDCVSGQFSTQLYFYETPKCEKPTSDRGCVNRTSVDRASVNRVVGPRTPIKNDQVRTTLKDDQSYQSGGRETSEVSLTLNSDPVLIAVATVGGCDPSQITSPGRDTAVTALGHIREVCPNVTPEEINRRAGNYAQHFKTAAITPAALARYWAKCEKPPLVTTSQPHEAPLKKVYDTNS